MQTIHPATFAAIVPSLLVLAGSAACTPKPAAEIPSPGPSPLKVGRGFLEFTDTEVTEFEIARGPGGGPSGGTISGASVTGWSARLSARPSSDHGKPTLDWRIESFSDGKELLDRQAHSARLNHLLDTLHTLNVAEIPACYASAECKPLARYGLSPPSFALRWRTGSQGRAFELEIGAPADPKAGSAWVRVPSLGDRVFAAQGAALAMLANLAEPTWVRERRWIPVDLDSIEEIQGPGGFYLQRDGDHWARKNHKPVSQDLDLILDRVLHQQIVRFIDDPNEAAALRGKLLSARGTRVLSFDGRGLPPKGATRIWINPAITSDRAILAATTARGGDGAGGGAPSVFWVYPEAATAIDALLGK